MVYFSALNTPYGIYTVRFMFHNGGMSHYRRLYMPGGTYFFTVNIQDRTQTLLTDHIEELHMAICDVKSRHTFSIEAYVILPDHLHMIWSLPDMDRNFSMRWRLIKSGFSRRLPATSETRPGRRKGERGIWQRRFWERLIRDENEHAALTEYIQTNPVKHGYTDHPKNWPHSSWHGAYAVL